MMKIQPKLTVLCGLPRIGKSSWIKQNKGNACIVCPDDIRREMFGHQFHAPANQFVFGIAEGMATLLLKQNHDVIIDATNINAASRSSWSRIANNCNAKSELIWIYASKDPVENFCACLEHNHLSPKHEQVPIDALFKMAMYFYPPDVFMEEGAFNEIKEYQSIHRRELPPELRINISKEDDIFTIADKGRELWHVVENKEQDS